MRILMVHNSYPPEFTGAGLQGHQLAVCLRDRGVDVTVLAGTRRFDMQGYGQIDGIPVFRVLYD